MTTPAACYCANMNQPLTIPLTIEGPTGALEASLTRTDSTGTDSSRLAVLCHPHPLYGGSMNDGILGILETALLATGTDCLRFNFRGVGSSAGQHDGNGGEVEDLKAVIAWVHSERAGGRLLLGGYSFGASTVCRLLAEAHPAELERVVLVAPPVGNLPVPAPDGRVPVDVFSGDADPYVDQQVLATWNTVNRHTLKGADHFFGGYWTELEAEVRAALS